MAKTINRGGNYDALYSCGTPFAALIGSILSRLTEIPSYHYSTSFTGNWRWWRGEVETFSGFKVPIRDAVRQVLGDGIREIPRRRLLLKWGLENAECFFTSSFHVRASLQHIGLDCEDVPVLYPPVEVPIQTNVERTIAPRITYFGHLWQGRGVLDLVRAFSIVTRNEEAELLIASNNVHRLTERLLEKMVESEGIGSKIVRTGVVRNLLAQVLLPSKLIALPYRDTPSMKLLESMAAGRPVVTTNIGWVPELIANAKNGFVIEVGDINLLAGRIMDILRDDDLASRLGSQAQSTIREMCDPLRHAEQIARVFRAN